MRILVCGGRSYSDRFEMNVYLGGLHQRFPDLIVICGYDPDDERFQGADQLAYEWAKLNRVPVATHPASWRRYGKSAGPRRNARQLADMLPERAVAFPGGAGTADMIRRLEAAGVHVTRVPARNTTPDHRE